MVRYPLASAVVFSAWVSSPQDTQAQILLCKEVNITPIETSIFKDNYVHHQQYTFT